MRIKSRAERDMRLVLTYLTTILVLSITAVTTAAETEFQPVQLTTADGLVNNTVRKIIQDSEGHIWVATSNGLSMYDGRHFTNFRPLHGNNNTPCLADQRIKDIYEDHDKRLWIFSPTDTVSCYDIKRKRFIDYKTHKLQIPTNPDTTSISQITYLDGRIWKVVKGKGVYIINPKTGTTEHISTDSPFLQLPTNALKCIMQDREGNIWIGTDNLGITLLKVTHNDGFEYILEGKCIRMLTDLGNNMIAIGDLDGNVWIYNQTLDSCLRTIHHNANTYCMRIDKGGRLWEGTKGDGLYIGQKQYLADNSKTGSLSHNNIYSLLCDNSGRTWVGTFGGGLCLAEQNRNGSYTFRTFLNDSYGTKRIRAMIQDNNGRIWVATSEGVCIFNPSEIIKDPNAFIHLTTANGKLRSDEIRTIFKSNKGHIYIAETGEGFCIDGTKHFGTTDSLVNPMVQCFAEDREGIIWISTELGVSTYNPRNDNFTNYFFTRKMINNVYSENCGLTMADGRIAFGTNNGVIIINPSFYNSDGQGQAIEADEVTLDGHDIRHDTKYIVRTWWKSPLAITLYIIITAAAIIYLLRVKHNNKRFHHAIKTLRTQKEDLAEKFSNDINIRKKSNKSADDNEFMTKVDDILGKQLANSDFTANDFAAQMGLGRTVFFNRMKEITGYSPKEYINAKRIKRAAELISTTSLTISEISYMVGISDPLYFSRIFKVEYGCSPTEWRKRTNIKR